MKYAMNRIFRLLALTVAAMLMPAAVSAQFVDFGPAPRFVEVDIHLLGGTTGITQNYNKEFTEITEFTASTGAGFGAGAGAVFGLRGWLGLGTEANILFGHNKLNMAVSNDLTSVSNIFIRNRYVYANFPVYMSFRFNIFQGLRWNVDAGIYYSYGLGGKQKQTIYNSTVNAMGQLVPRVETANPGYFNNDQTFINSYRRSDIGLHLTTSLLFGRHFSVGVRSQIGFKNISYNSGLRNPNIHNVNLLAVVGYKF